jgi:hypothetical protein
MKAEKPFGKILFNEEQSFRQTWLWLLLAGSFVMPLVLTAVLSMQDQKTPVPVMAYVVILLFGIINLTGFYVARFETVVTDEAVFYRWMPFVRKYTVINQADIKSIVFKKFPYLHYGYHRSFKFGKAHNVNGNKGALFELVNNKRIYVGSQRLAAFYHALALVKPQIVTSEIKDIE